MVDLADGGDWGRWHLSYWQMVLVFRCCFPLFNIKLTCNFLLLCFEISLHGILKPNGVSVYRCKMIEGDRCPHTVQLSLKHVIGRTNKFSALVWCHCWYLSAFVWWHWYQSALLWCPCLGRRIINQPAPGLMIFLSPVSFDLCLYNENR